MGIVHLRKNHVMCSYRCMQRHSMPSVAREFTPPLAIRGGTLFDGAGEAPRPNDLLGIGHGRIARVGGEERVPPGATLVDAAGLSILPGLNQLHLQNARLAREAS